MDGSFLSRDEKGRTRLDCVINGETTSYLWEPIRGGSIEITFNGNGYILRQELCNDPEKRIADALARFGPASNIEFNDVKIDKRCPSCNADALSRHCEASASSSSAPVMPIYHCNSCNGRSYYLTDEYLGYLVDAKRDLFENSELESMANDRVLFLTELKDYIIRIFASKRILTIK